MRKKRIVSILLSTVLMLNNAGPAVVSAENDTIKYEYEGYTVYYTVVSSWDKNKNVSIRIENTGDKAIDNWAVEYISDGKINNIWNGKVYDHENNCYVIQNSGYNHSIPPKQSVNFGYIIEGDNISDPESIKLCTETEDITEYCGISYNIVHDYGYRYQAEIIINNNSEDDIESWTLYQPSLKFQNIPFF